MQTVGIIVVGGMLMAGAIVSVLVLLGMSKQKRYEQDMIFLESAIRNWIVTYSNYITLKQLFSDIASNDYDPERTRMLWLQFKVKFEKYTTVQGLKEVIKIN